MEIVLNGFPSKKEENFIRGMGISIIKEDERCSFCLPNGWKQVFLKEKNEQRKTPLNVGEKVVEKKDDEHGQREKSLIILDENNIPKFMIDCREMLYQIKLPYTYGYKVMAGSQGLLVLITKRGKIINRFSVPFFTKTEEKEKDTETIRVTIIEAHTIAKQWLTNNYPEWAAAVA